MNLCGWCRVAVQVSLSPFAAAALAVLADSLAEWGSVFLAPHTSTSVSPSCVFPVPGCLVPVVGHIWC